MRKGKAATTFSFCGVKHTKSLFTIDKSVLVLDLVVTAATDARDAAVVVNAVAAAAASAVGRRLVVSPVANKRKQFFLPPPVT